MIIVITELNIHPHVSYNSNTIQYLVSLESKLDMRVNIHPRKWELCQYVYY